MSEANDHCEQLLLPLDQLLLPLDKVGTIPQRRVIKGQVRIVTVWEVERKVQREAKALARFLADLANYELEGTRWLYREIMSRSGIRRYRSEFEPQEEYEGHVPLWYRRRNGLPPDEMADELGFFSDTELYKQIDRAELARRRVLQGVPRGVYRFRVMDFIDEAKDLVREAYVLGENPLSLICCWGRV